MTDSGFFDHVFESAHNGIVVLDRAGIICVFNRAAREILGFSDAKLVGQPHSRILPDIWPELKEVMNTGLPQLGRQIQIGTQSILANRTPVWQEEKVVGIVSVFSGLDEAEKALTELEAYKSLANQLEAIFESSYDGIYVTDGDAITLRVNKSYERISGFGRNTLIGRNMNDLVDAGFFDRSVSIEALKSGSPVTIMQDIRGGKRVIVTGTPIINKTTGMVDLVVTNVRDITELDHLRSQLVRLKTASKFYSQELERLMNFDQVGMSVVARSPAMLSVLDSVVRVSHFDTTVLITGESGVGKGVIARLTHKLSGRKEGPFVKINCASIPGALLESELFGYEPGAFSGASPKGKPGFFEVAHGGTLFLDEIGDLPLPLQVKLLHVLEDRAVIHVGGNKEIPVDVRIVAATNRNLTEAVAQGTFRRDLYYRLQVVPIEIPPLRSRREDILPLALAFVKRISKELGKDFEFAPSVVDQLMSYDYPGNVRELENLIERMVVMAPDREGLLSTFPELSGTTFPAAGVVVSSDRPLRETLDRVEREVLETALKRWGSTYKIARQLGLNQSTVFRKLKKHGLKLDAVMH